MFIIALVIRDLVGLYLTEEELGKAPYSLSADRIKRVKTYALANNLFKKDKYAAHELKYFYEVEDKASVKRKVLDRARVEISAHASDVLSLMNAGPALSLFDEGASDAGGPVPDAAVSSRRGALPKKARVERVVTAATVATVKKDIVKLIGAAGILKVELAGIPYNEGCPNQNVINLWFTVCCFTYVQKLYS